MRVVVTVGARASKEGSRGVCWGGGRRGVGLEGRRERPKERQERRQREVRR